MTQTVNVRRVASLGELEALGPLWNALQDGCDHQHVLMDHRWILAWWRHFGADKAQHTLVLSNGSTPIGIAPLAITRGFEAFPFRDAYVISVDDYQHLPRLRWQRVVPIRRLTFPVNIASANGRGQIISPYSDATLYSAVSKYVADAAGSWDVATFPGMRTWTQEDAMLINAARGAGLTPGARRTTRDMLYRDLPATWSEFLQMRSRNFREYLRRECNKIEKDLAPLGPMKVSCLRGKEIASGIDRLFALELESWKVSDKKQRRLHLALDERVRSFYRNVALRFAEDDNAQILILSFGDKDAAGLFSLERGGTSVAVTLYRSENLGRPITAAPLFRELFERSILNGIRCIDFNGFTRNYMKWAKDHRTYAQPIIFNSGPYSRLLRAIDGGALALRRLVPHHEGAPSEQARLSS